MNLRVNYSKRGQLKIQQMAFVLVVVMIFFAIIALIYFTISLSDLRGKAQELKEQEASELVRKIVGTSEFIWKRDCSSCIDLDKVFLLKDRASYKEFWELNFLQIKKIYPTGIGECNKANYPNCDTITIVENGEVGTPSSAYVSLCRWEQEKGGYVKCEIGRIYATAKKIAE